MFNELVAEQGQWGMVGFMFCPVVPAGEPTPMNPFGLEGESVAECRQEPGVHRAACGQAAAEGAPSWRGL